MSTRRKGKPVNLRVFRPEGYRPVPSLPLDAVERVEFDLLVDELDAMLVVHPVDGSILTLYALAYGIMIGAIERARSLPPRPPGERRRREPSIVIARSQLAHLRTFLPHLLRPPLATARLKLAAEAIQAIDGPEARKADRA